MSMTPSIPDMGGNKSFWKRPEGKTGMLTLIVGGSLAAFFFGPVILGTIMLLLVDTVHICILGAILLGIFFLATNHTVHITVGRAFRMVMRLITGWIITIDPIGILKDRLKDMRKRREALAEQITNVNGQRVTLRNIIAKNEADAQKSFGMASEARKRAQSAEDVEYQRRMNLQLQKNANHSKRLENANVGYTTLLNKLDKIYNFLSKWADNIDFFIDDTDDEVKQQEVQYKALNAGFKAFKTAMSVISGNTDENELYNDTMQYLADEAGRKIGYMEEAQRTAQKFMDSADLSAGAVSADAMAELDAYEQKFLTSGNEETSFLLPGAQPHKTPVTINAYSPKASTNDAGPWRI